MADENAEVADEQEANPYADIFDEGDEVPADPPAEQEGEPETEVEPESPPETTDKDTQGVSLLMRENALTQGLPSSLVDACYDDAQVAHFLEMKRMAEGQPQPAEATPPKFLIADDDFDPKDPVHQQLKNTHQELQEFKDSIYQELGEAMQGVRNLLTDRQRDIQTSINRDFDSTADGFKSELLGKSGSPARKQAHKLYLALVADEPNSDRKKLAEQALLAKHPALLKAKARKTQERALEKQKKDVLGGGHVLRTTDPPKSGREEFLEFLRSVPSKN